MRELAIGEVENIDGGLIPAIWAGVMLYNYITVAYSATQIAFAAGAVVGAGAAVAAAMD